MEKLIFLSHRIPYPPNKGDKIRSFNILKFLSQYYEIHLGTFIDDPEDFKYQDNLKPYVKDIICLPLSRTALSQIKGAGTAFIKHQPITLPCFYAKQMDTWVKQTIKNHNINKAFIFCSSMAPYLDDPNYSNINRVIDFVDVDSDKWRQYALSKRPPISWVYAREHKLLGRYENKIVDKFNTSLLVSPDEAKLLRSQAEPNNQDKIKAVINGVDTEFFNPHADIQTLAELSKDKFISFTGAMDYWANEEAALWFSRNVWPSIKAQYPELKFYIVGGKPSETLLQIQQDPSIVVTGRVKDIRPYILQAELSVAPLRIARGIQNKVLEAMSMAKTVVMTGMAAEGINLPNSQTKLVSDDANTMANNITNMLADKESIEKIGLANREWILQNYQWFAVLEPLVKYLETNNKG